MSAFIVLGLVYSVHTMRSDLLGSMSPK